MTPSYCIFCEILLTQQSDSKEHIIPKAIGGRKTVTGFICRPCNNKYGADWDAELSKRLSPLSLYLGISRQDGDVPSQTMPTLGGDHVRLNADGTKSIARPKFDITQEGGSTKLEIRAPSRKVLRQALAGMQRKYTKLKNMDLDDLMALASDESYYSDDPIEISQSFGGPEAGRALVKSPVALIFDAGVDPRQCDLAFDYLLNPDGKPCFGYYYDCERDLVINRPSGVPLHCICVKGSKETGNNTRVCGILRDTQNRIVSLRIIRWRRF